MRRRKSSSRRHWDSEEQKPAGGECRRMVRSGPCTNLRFASVPGMSAHGGTTDPAQLTEIGRGVHGFWTGSLTFSERRMPHGFWRLRWRAERAVERRDGCWLRAGSSRVIVRVMTC
jgi:hypothetical protein